MRRGGAPEGEKVMGPLFPRLHVNDTTLKGGGPRAPPRNKMALYEQFSVPSSQRFSAAANAPTPPAQPHRPAASYAVSSASTGHIGGGERPLFPSFCAPSNEPVRSSDGRTAAPSTHSNGRDGSAARAESGRLSSQQLRSKDAAHPAGSTAECSSQRREAHTTRSSAGTKKPTNEDDCTVPSVFSSIARPAHPAPTPAREEARVQEKPTSFPMFKSGPTLSKPSARYSVADKRFLEGTNASDARSRDSPSVKDRAPAMTRANLEAGERSSSFRYFSAEKAGKADGKVSSYRDQGSNVDVSGKQRPQTEMHEARRRDENTAESQNAPKAGNGPYSTGIDCNVASDLAERGLREAGEKRKRSSAGHRDVERDESPDSSVESLPGPEIKPEDVVGAIGQKHFWKARRAIVNQQRVFAVQVFELHRLIKVQKLIAASPHLLIEGDPCLGSALAASKKQLAVATAEKQQLSSAKTKDDDDDEDGARLALQQAEYSRDNTEGNQASSDDAVEVQHNSSHHQATAAASQGAVSSNPPPAMPAPPDDSNKPSNNTNWCAPPPPPPSQWLVPVMSPSEGLVYKPYAGPCPPAGSFLAPFYASCAPLSIPSAAAAGDFMASPYGIPMPHHHHHQAQHMGVGGPPTMPMPPMYFPPFSMPAMHNPASVVEQAAARGRANAHAESFNMRNEGVSAGGGGGGVWRFHSSRDSELQGSSAASSPFDRQQQKGEAARPAATAPPLPASSAGPQPSSGTSSKENPAVAGRVIRVVPRSAHTASESAVRILRSIQMERQQNDP